MGYFTKKWLLTSIFVIFDIFVKKQPLLRSEMTVFTGPHSQKPLSMVFIGSEGSQNLYVFEQKPVILVKTSDFSPKR